MGFGLFVVFIFVVLLFTIGEKKAFLCFFTLCIMGCQYSMSGPVTLEDVLIVLFLFLTIQKKSTPPKMKGYPFWLCTGLYSASVLISSFFTEIAPHYGLASMECLRIIVLPMLFFYYVRNKRDLHFLVQLMVAISIFGILLAILEEVFQEKFYLKFVRSYFGENAGWEMSQVRYGFTRAQAFCMQSVSYGYICVTLLSIFLLFIHKYNKKLQLTIVEYTLVVMSCVLGCLLAGSRSSILPLALCLLYFYGRRNFGVRNLTVLMPVIVVVYIVYGSNIENMWESIFQSNDVQMGSSSDLRLNQLDISLHYFKKSPIIGLGTNAITDFVKDSRYESILGGESVWFSLLINQGILGCITYIFIYISSFLYIKDLKFDAFLFLALQMIMHTLTSTPGYDTSLILCLVLFAQKVHFYYGSKDISKLKLMKD